ncbi:MAG: family 10 glycosylhydrolase [Planctomycetota bacterium]
MPLLTRAGLLGVLLAMWGVQASGAPPEVRGTWLTTTANTHLATASDTAETMRRLREIGLNTVYVEAWKNGYTQFPSETLERVIGVERRPALIKQDPGDPDGPVEARDLLQECVIEAHRNGLMCIAWFEYGFMAAHKDTQNHLREMKPEWLSQDIEGNVVAPNGFVWMNPLHPETRRFLMDLVLEAVDTYDLDGVQLDDRIVWPYVTMGYDSYTRAAYANDHRGKQPPEDPRDPDWMRWRADKINGYARQFVEELRAERPGLIVSLSPAPYPWCFENYLLEWPEWATWGPGNTDGVLGAGVWWDEFIPQCYRYDFPAFKRTWDEQVENLREAGASDRVKDMLAGVLTTGSRPDPVPWTDLQPAIEHVRATGGGGHVWWFSRGVLDEYPEEIAALYDTASNGQAPHPGRPLDWRPAPIELFSARDPSWRSITEVEDGRYRVMALRGGVWERVGVTRVEGGRARVPSGEVGRADRVELLRDRREELKTWRRSYE